MTLEVYIDVDTLPKEDRPLGNIEIDDKLGFCKPPGNTNDVLAALPRSPFVHRVKEKDLSQKFITESDQNWRDKGPQNPKEQHEYFKEEMLFRLKHQCEKELKDLFQSLPSNSPERGLLHSLITKLERSHETMPIKDIFHSWIKSAEIEGIPQNIVDLIERTKSIADRLNASELSPQQITALKTNLFPKERYRLISPDSSDTELNKQFIRSNMTMREIHEQFFEIAPIPWIQRMTQFVSSLIFQEPPAPYRIDPHIQHASADVVGSYFIDNKCAI